MRVRCGRVETATRSGKLALTLHKSEGDRDDYDVMSECMPIGRIYRRKLGPDAPSWLWSITGVKDGPAGMINTGTAHTLQQATEELEANWRRWVRWAGLAEQSSEQLAVQREK